MEPDKILQVGSKAWCPRVVTGGKEIYIAKVIVHHVVPRRLDETKQYYGVGTVGEPRTLAILVVHSWLISIDTTGEELKRIENSLIKKLQKQENKLKMCDRRRLLMYSLVRKAGASWDNVIRTLDGDIDKLFGNVEYYTLPFERVSPGYLFDIRGFNPVSCKEGEFHTNLKMDFGCIHLDKQSMILDSLADIDGMRYFQTGFSEIDIADMKKQRLTEWKAEANSESKFILFEFYIEALKTIGKQRKSWRRKNISFMELVKEKVGGSIFCTLPVCKIAEFEYPSFINNQKLYQHFEKHHSVVPGKWACRICLKYEPSKWKLSSHVHGVHSDQFPIQLCVENMKELDRKELKIRSVIKEIMKM